MQLDEFVKKVQLHKIKPDLRVYSFNNPTPVANETYGYEFWVTIPDDMEVPAPLQKKSFAGGLYAAHCIKMGDFHEWEWLIQWLNNNNEYEYEQREPSGMQGSLEEHLNAYTNITKGISVAHAAQIDLLIPIKPKTT